MCQELSHQKYIVQYLHFNQPLVYIEIQVKDLAAKPQTRHSTISISQTFPDVVPSVKPSNYFRYVKLNAPSSSSSRDPSFVPNVSLLGKPSLAPKLLHSLRVSTDPSHGPSNKTSTLSFFVISVDHSGDPIFIPKYVLSRGPSIASR